MDVGQVKTRSVKGTTSRVSAALVWPSLAGTLAVGLGVGFVGVLAEGFGFGVGFLLAF